MEKELFNPENIEPTSQSITSGQRRADNLVKHMWGENVPPTLTREEKEMKKLLIEAYRPKGLNLLDEVTRYRAEHEGAKYADAIRVLYEQIENEK